MLQVGATGSRIMIAQTIANTTFQVAQFIEKARQSVEIPDCEPWPGSAKVCYPPLWIKVANGNKDDGEAMKEFASVVTDIREESRIQGRQRWQMRLERTEFSAGDAGMLEAAARSGAMLVMPVLQVVTDAAGEVWHVVEKPLAAGTRVTGRVAEAEEVV